MHSKALVSMCFLNDWLIHIQEEVSTKHIDPQLKWEDGRGCSESNPKAARSGNRRARQWCLPPRVCAPGKEKDFGWKWAVPVTRRSHRIRVSGLKTYILKVSCVEFVNTGTSVKARNYIRISNHDAQYVFTYVSLFIFRLLLCIALPNPLCPLHFKINK